MYRTKIHRELDQVLAMMPQAESNNKKEKQTTIVLRVLENQNESKRPKEIAGLAGINQPSVRRVLGVLVRLDKAKRDANNQYSIIR